MFLGHLPTTLDTTNKAQSNVKSLLVVPVCQQSRADAAVAISSCGLVVVVPYDHAFSIYIQTLGEKTFGRKPYFDFGPAEASVLTGNLTVLAALYVFALLSAWFGSWLFVKHKSKWGYRLEELRYRETCQAARCSARRCDADLARLCPRWHGGCDLSIRIHRECRCGHSPERNPRCL